jgi:hypothetical protein
MASLLMPCPQCRSMIAKGYPCPDCNWSEQVESDGTPDADFVAEYAHREKMHLRNYTLYMILMLGTGLVGALTAYMWFRFMYMGSIRAFIMVGFLTILTAGLGVAVKFSGNFWPTRFNCPACDVRLDQIGLSGESCPGCSIRLKSTTAIDGQPA